MLWIWLLCFVFVCNSERIYEGLVVYHDELKLPDLPYDYNALEPYIDEATVKVHHLGHHKTYGDNTNKALKEWREAVSCVCVIRWLCAMLPRFMLLIYDKTIHRIPHHRSHVPLL